MEATDPPTVTLGALPMAAIVRLLRASMLATLQLDYVTVARAKGVPEFWVVVKHAFRNATIPAATFIGLQFGTLFGGAVVTEMIFAWPGVGRLVVLAIYNRDYPLVQATVIFLSTMFVAVNFGVDLLYGLLDPGSGSEERGERKRPAGETRMIFSRKYPKKFFVACFIMGGAVFCALPAPGLRPMTP